MIKTKNIFPIVFTDLDGTLLDEQNYSWTEASEAITFLKNRGIPIIPCTSKTEQEVILFCQKINNHAPFIVENGSAVFIPPGLFDLNAYHLELYQNYSVLVLGKKHEEVTRFFDKLRKKFNLPAIGLSEMSTADIQSHTGLSASEAAIAGSRSYSEPFVLVKPYDHFEQVCNFASQNQFIILKGNRFFHLLGNTDKGKAVETLRKFYEQKYPDFKIITVGLGDSPNDFDMLHVVDYPVLINKASGWFYKEMDIPNLQITKHIGPAGWQEAIFNIFRKN
jgi:mannosyl-3-phosphoglycerate phosphatase